MRVVFSERGFPLRTGLYANDTLLDSVYKYPTGNDGWISAITLPDEARKRRLSAQFCDWDGPVCSQFTGSPLKQAKSSSSSSAKASSLSPPPTGPVTMVGNGEFDLNGDLLE